MFKFNQLMEYSGMIQPDFLIVIEQSFELEELMSTIRRIFQPKID